MCTTNDHLYSGLPLKMIPQILSTICKKNISEMLPKQKAQHGIPFINFEPEIS